MSIKDRICKVSIYTRRNKTDQDGTSINILIVVHVLVDQCPVLNHTSISGGQINCSHPIAPYSYNSTCDFMCDEGYELSGQDHTRCDHSGRWTASIPTCASKVAVVTLSFLIVCVTYFKVS